MPALTLLALRTNAVMLRRKRCLGRPRSRCQIFIDRDPVVFRAILNFLRTTNVTLDET